MIDLLICGMNIACHFRTVGEQIQRPKYPPDVAQLCIYFEESKVELPEYCKWTDQPKSPRKRNEF